MRCAALKSLCVLLLIAASSAPGQVLFQHDLPGSLIAQGPQPGGKPVIIRPPANQVVSPGDYGGFSVVVANPLSVTYQWRFNGSALPGAQAASLLLTNVSAASEGSYAVVVANASGSVTSAPAMLYWDSVGDGIADSWKIRYFGSVTNVTASSDSPLHDGIANLQKFLDGINPTNGVGLRPRLTLAGWNGSVSALPDLDKYTLGQDVTLTATPRVGFHFVGWSGGLLGTNNPATLTMNTNRSVTAVCGLPLPDTLDTTNILWRTGGDVPWFGQDYVSYDGVAAAQNGPIDVDQVSWLEATVYMKGEGTLTFWWKRVAGASIDLTVTINGVRQLEQISGSDWSQITYYLPAGTDVIRWTYEKRAAAFLGFDAVWVDQVVATVYTDPLDDRDFDGLPDLWEYNSFGTLIQLGNSDQDSDGVNNHDEYLDGTDPRSSISAFPRLAISASGGTITRAPSLPKYPYLQPVTLTAVPNAGYRFVGWGGDLTGPANPAVLTMDESKAVTAHFALTAASVLADSVDATNLTWSTGGDAPFFGQTLTTHDGADAAQSGPLIGSQQSWLQTTVAGPGPLSFWWKSKASFGRLEFQLNGAAQRNVSGDSGWQRVTLNLAAGSNVLRWVFIENFTSFPTSDAGYVDQVVFGTNAPLLTTLPISRSLLQGSNVTFTVGATSSVPFSDRWQKNGINLTDGPDVSGAATATLVLSNLQPADSGTYSVLVSNSTSTVSAAATLKVIALVPLEQSLDAPGLVWSSGGSSSWFGQNGVTHDGVDAAQSGNLGSAQESWVETTVNGPGALQFWWKVSCLASVNRLDFLMNGSTNASLSGEVDWVPRSFLLPPGPSTVRWRFLQTAFSLTVTQAAWLDQVVVLAGLPPAITAQPSSQTVTGGVNVSFSVAATGAGPLNYQWYYQRTNLVGGNSATLSLNNVQLANAGAYSVLVSNSLGKVISTTAELTVDVPPFITAQPAGDTVLVGSDVTLSVSAGGAAPLDYQWRKDGTRLAAATQPDLVLTNAQIAQSGAYTVVISNWLGSVTSAVAQLVVGVAPSIVTQPQDQTVNQGSTVTLSVVATGTAPLYYQWQKSGIDLSGAASSSLSLTNVQFADSGFYTVVVSNALGTATSDGAQVTVGFATALFILVQPSGQNVSPGGTASFSVIADGAPPLFYRWRKDGIPLAAAAATGSSLLLTNVQLSDAGGYSVVVSNVSGAITSVVAFLTVGQPGEVRLSIAVSNGLANLRWSAVSGRSYQVEYKADLPLPTWSNLLPAIVASGPSASATDVVGTRLRRFYRIEILPQANTPPSILVPPVNQTVPAGANVTFTVMADGTPPLSYQWLVNGSEIPGATSASLPLNNVQVTDTGIYEVAVGNAFGSVTSEPVFLFVTGF